MRKCPNSFYAEIKYDGERVQLHKRGMEFQYFSRSLKPVLPHKVSCFHIPLKLDSNRMTLVENLQNNQLSPALYKFSYPQQIKLVFVCTLDTRVRCKALLSLPILAIKNLDSTYICNTFLVFFPGNFDVMCWLKSPVRPGDKLNESIPCTA